MKSWKKIIFWPSRTGLGCRWNVKNKNFAFNSNAVDYYETKKFYFWFFTFEIDFDLVKNVVVKIFNNFSEISFFSEINVFQQFRLAIAKFLKQDKLKPDAKYLTFYSDFFTILYIFCLHYLKSICLLHLTLSFWSCQDNKQSFNAFRHLS